MGESTLVRRNSVKAWLNLLEIVSGFAQRNLKGTILKPPAIEGGFFVLG